MSTFAEKRTKVETLILGIYSTIDPSGTNTERMKAFMSKMSDTAFEKWMKDLRDKKAKLTLVAPNLVVTLQTENIFKAAKKLDLKLLEKVKLRDRVTGKEYVPNQEYLVLRMPIRRVKQFLKDKISIPESDRNRDFMSGQVIKPDKGSALSNIEMQQIWARGQDKALTEFVKGRGGDINTYNEMVRQIQETGRVNIENLGDDSRARSAVVANVLLEGMMIEGNLYE